jgi:hypothetical protein
VENQTKFETSVRGESLRPIRPGELRLARPLEETKARREIG